MQPTMNAITTTTNLTMSSKKYVCQHRAKMFDAKNQLKNHKKMPTRKSIQTYSRSSVDDDDDSNYDTNNYYTNQFTHY